MVDYEDLGNVSKGALSGNDLGIFGVEYRADRLKREAQQKQNELEREAQQKQNEDKSKLAKFLKHPLVVAIFSVILTLLLQKLFE